MQADFANGVLIRFLMSSYCRTLHLSLKIQVQAVNVVFGVHSTTWCAFRIRIKRHAVLWRYISKYPRACTNPQSLRIPKLLVRQLSQTVVLPSGIDRCPWYTEKVDLRPSA